MAALAAYLAEQERREAQTIYIGNALWQIATAGNPNIALRPLSEIMHEDIVQDNRTAGQIIAGILEQLGK